jgi:hypothetical protein
MLDHDQLVPEEMQEENQFLIADLSRYYETRDEDSASLARIRARLLQNTAASLPVADSAEISPFSRPLRARRRLNVVRPLARHPYLNSLVAALLLILLVSAFVLALQSRRGTTMISNPPAIAHGWSLVATFHGTGNQTITGQDIEVGHRYGWLATCTGSTDSGVSFAINGHDTGGYDSCSTQTAGPLGPEGSFQSLEVLAPIQTIKIKAAASTSWNLMFFKGIYYPLLSIDTAHWHTLYNETQGSGPGTLLANITLPKIWALQYVCRGTGDFKMSLQSYAQPNSPSNQPDVSRVNEACDGQIHLDVSEATGPNYSTIHQIQITTGADNDWQVMLLSCANSQPHCGITTIDPTPTP